MNAMIPNGLSSSPVEIDISASNGNMLAQHDLYFSTVLADSPELVEAAHALRFQVYCLERKFENADEHPDGLEFDEYDANAVQGVLYHRPTQDIIGSARLILPRGGNVQDSFPIAKLLKTNSFDLENYVIPEQTIEISRFAISKEFRRRKTDEAVGSELTHTATSREASLAFLSLLQFVLRESIKRDVWFWTAVMEPKFLRLLARMGICYTPVGPVVMHHGIRQPCFCYLPDMLETARRIQPQCWGVLTDGGILHEQLYSRLFGRAVA